MILRQCYALPERTVSHRASRCHRCVISVIDMQLLHAPGSMATPVLISAPQAALLGGLLTGVQPDLACNEARRPQKLLHRLCRSQMIIAGPRLIVAVWPKNVSMSNQDT